MKNKILCTKNFLPQVLLVTPKLSGFGDMCYVKTIITDGQAQNEIYSAGSETSITMKKSKSEQKIKSVIFFTETYTILPIYVHIVKCICILGSKMTLEEIV